MALQEFLLQRTENGMLQPLPEVGQHRGRHRGPIKSWLEPTAEVYVVVNVPKLRRIEGLEQARENPISLYLTYIYEDSDRRFELLTSTM